MATRREFFQYAAALSGGGRLLSLLLPSIERAHAIDPPAGSSYLDAEHVVVLMQENRSFDHVFGRLRGVRGYNDPRAVSLPDGKPVWLQSNSAGETYAPFHLDLHATNATWMGSLPHSWSNQLDARNQGNHDGWLDAKKSGHKDYAAMPLTLGYYDRRDVPFYYALADAFTVCDQHFCSSLTATTPNRLFLWTGTVRGTASSLPCIRNGEADYDTPVRWTTFPERLEDAGVSWKIYQNELSLDTGFSAEEDAWLANFTDNPIEFFEQFNAGFSATYRRRLHHLADSLPAEIERMRNTPPPSDPAESARLARALAAREAKLRRVRAHLPRFTDEALARLSTRDRSLHDRAFTTNSADPDYRRLTTLQYRDGEHAREMQIPKGDVLHQFRRDVETGSLPTVSWLVAPETFSDHPSAPWYGAWYVAEALDILTRNPAVWKKTIFILTYDENDGYFDHVPPFVAPDPRNPESGKVSPGLDPAVEYLHLEDDRTRSSARDARGGPVGLGFRVPLVVASPWSRGGYVCSQVFDHTSVLRLLENVLTRRLGREVRETNISAWRRAVCGDLSTAFRPDGDESSKSPDFPARERFLQGVHQAQFQPAPSGFRNLASTPPSNSDWKTRQEPGTRPSCPLPYDLHANAALTADGKHLRLTLEARNAGSPFHAYTPRLFRQRKDLRTRAYAVAAGQRLEDTWELTGFENGVYHLRLHGPNGFFREFTGDADDPRIDLECRYLTVGDLEFRVASRAGSPVRIQLEDLSYKTGKRTLEIRPGAERISVLRLNRSHQWYDFAVTIDGAARYLRRYAGRVETGKPGVSDPAMA